ncbi:heat shock factor protein 1 isoform X2 [Cololabis saira]|uniref:heat shock factor protein 1 isoform X2 n=1 Tax=Cololabis saira TaxID=129043 RepID=UPI002AD4BE1A|nr:heat shock factor protein 1 isoform X2 [Cololabis saira]
MEFHAGGGGAAMVLSGGNVPAFLTKLWTLVEDPDTDQLICWSPSGTSFHVFDQGRFSKEVLPKFFKHNNMASFIRQLNMYGFRKVVHIEQGGLLKPEKDDTEFQHPFFIRGQDRLLENIKRKVTNVSSVRQEEGKMSSDEVSKILNDVQLMKGKQETIDSRIIAMKHENESLWREVASLRQKHAQQQKVVNKLIQFLVSLIQTNRIMGVKRKIPLMLNDSSSTHSLPKYSRPFSLDHVQAAASPFSAESLLNSGPVISDITELVTHTPEEVVGDCADPRQIQLADIKQEPSSPEVEECPVLEEESASVETPLSPTTFINSILQDETPPTPVSSTISPTASSIVVMNPAATGSVSTAPANQLPGLAATNSAVNPTMAEKKCQTVACIGRLSLSATSHSSQNKAASARNTQVRGLQHDESRVTARCELSNHVDSIDNGLENLQNILNSQTFTFDAAPLMEFFGSSSAVGDFDLDSLDNLLSDEPPRDSDINTGKQLVQYTASPFQVSEPAGLGEVGADLPSLLELETEPFFGSDTPTDDPADALLRHTHLDSNL